MPDTGLLVEVAANTTGVVCYSKGCMPPSPLQPPTGRAVLAPSVASSSELHQPRLMWAEADVAGAGYAGTAFPKGQHF